MMLTTKTASASRRSINGIQALRAYAAISVVVGHGFLEAMSNVGESPSFSVFPLLAGVDIFFVVSGFIMIYTSHSLFGSSKGMQSFVKRRVARIVPMYWIMTTAMLVALLVLGGHVRSTELEIANVVGSYLFFPVERSGGRIAPILSLGWTLNYEMFFYLIFSIALLFKRPVGVAFLFLFIIALALSGVLFDYDSAALKFWTNSIILEFLIGVALGIAYLKFNIIRSTTLAAFSFAIGIALLFALDQFSPNLDRVLKAGFPAALLVLSALLLPEKVDIAIPNIIKLMGDSSYSLYLSHRFVLRLLTIIATPLLGSQHYVLAYTACASIVSLVFGVFVYWFVEKRTVSWSTVLLGTRDR